MAPFGPAPEMVGKLRPWMCSPSLRKVSRRSAALISVSPFPDPFIESQPRKRVRARPSRRCAARIPSNSTSFLQLLGRIQGSSSAFSLAPDASNFNRMASAIVSGSISIFASFFPRLSSADVNSLIVCIETSSLSNSATLGLTFLGSINRSRLASA